MIFKGPYPDVDDSRNCADALRPAPRRRTRRQASADRWSNRTHASLTHNWPTAISIAAHNLAQRGFKKGEVFGILSPNCPEYAIAFHAVATLGGIVTPINPLYTRTKSPINSKTPARASWLLCPLASEKAQRSGRRRRHRRTICLRRSRRRHAIRFTAGRQRPRRTGRDQSARRSGRASLFKRHHRTCRKA